MSAADLVAAFQTRYDDHTQRGWTRQNAPGSAATVDATKLTAAAEDSIEEFKYVTGIEFDSTNNLHLTVGCDLMEFFLAKRARAREQAKMLYEDLLPRLEGIKLMRANALSVDASTDQREPITPGASLEMDFDEQGAFWNGVGPSRNGSTYDFDENHPF